MIFSLIAFFISPCCSIVLSDYGFCPGLLSCPHENYDTVYRRNSSTEQKQHRAFKGIHVEDVS